MNDNWVSTGQGGRTQLIVDDTGSDDNSVVGLSLAKMDELDVFKGDTVLLKGPGGKVTTCIVLSDDFTTDENITMNQTIRNNLGVELGDVVSIQLPVNITYARRVLVLPVDERIRLTTNVLEAYLKPYFLEAYRPVHQGDIFIATDGNQPVEFMVVETDPPPYGIVAPDTILDGVQDLPENTHGGMEETIPA